MSSALLDKGRPEIPACWAFESGAEYKLGRPAHGWAAYWEGLGGTESFFREQAKEYVVNLECAVTLNRNAHVLDFGCGFGFVAETLAPKVGKVFLWDASANMRRRSRRNLADHQNIFYLDLSDPQATAGELKFDLIVVNSVVQYMSLEQFAVCLVMWRTMLAPGGGIVVSDLIAPEYNSFSDFVDLLKFSIQRNVLGSALLQAMRDLGRYWMMRRSCPLARISVAELSEIGEAAHLSVNCLPRNLTHFRRRLTAVFYSGEPVNLIRAFAT
jgi:cyclopropane fatty-acyl-phospholipid synthase-like methyltransferase